MSIQNTLEKWKSLRPQVDELETEMAKALKPYILFRSGQEAAAYHFDLNKDELEFRADLYYPRDGSETEYYAVSMGYFENPEEYIQKEKEAMEKDKDEKEEQMALAQLKQAEQLVANLRKRYPRQ